MSPLPASVRQRARADERGVIVIMFALLLVGLMVMAALVLEFGQIRDDRQTNKSAADFAVMAGLANIESASSQGVPQPWKGVCAAIQWLEANNSRFEGMSGTFTDGDGDAYASPASSDPCNNTGIAPYTTLCTPNDPDSWAWFQGVSSDGRLQVDIKSGYEMPDPDFTGTDTNALDGADTGDPDQGSCDNFAVIVGQARPRGFSAVIGSDDLSSQIRSVGRVLIGEENEQAVALLLLERVDCRAVITVGSNARIHVRSNLDEYNLSGDPEDARPGFIHADSNGSGSCPGGARVIEGQDLIPSNGLPDPSIKAEHARDALDNILAEARISTPSVSSNPTQAHSSWPDAVGEPEPETGPVIGRSPADDRYLDAIGAPTTGLYHTVNSTFAAGPSSAWHVVSGAACSSAGTVEPPALSGITKIWFDCNVNVPNGGTMLVQRDGAGNELTDVVINGSLNIGSGGQFRLGNVRRFYIDGKTTGDQRGVSNAGGTLAVNDANSGSCTDTPLNGDPDRITTMVLRKGSFYGSNGNTFLCQTFFYLMNNVNGYPNAPGTPLADQAPYTCTGCNGFLNVSGTGIVDWTAPNSIIGRQPTAADLATYPFEDLALWTEASNQSAIGGGGGISLTGIYFLPNANSYRLNGSGGQTIDATAQFITRKLEMNGNAVLSMLPDPHNSLPVPLFEGFLLVR